MSDSEGQVGKLNQSSATKTPSFTNNESQQQNSKTKNQIKEVKKQAVQYNDAKLIKIVTLQETKKKQLEKYKKKKNQAVILEDVHHQLAHFDENQQTQFTTKVETHSIQLSTFKINQYSKDYAEYKEQMDKLQVTLDKQNRQVTKLHQLIQTKTNCFCSQKINLKGTLDTMNSKMAQIKRLLEYYKGYSINQRGKINQQLANQQQEYSQQLIKNNQQHLEQINHILQIESTKYNEIVTHKNKQIQNFSEKLNCIQYQRIQLQRQINQLRYCSGNMIQRFQESYQNEIANFNHRQQILITQNKQLLKTYQQINEIQLIPTLEKLRIDSDLISDLSEQIEMLKNQAHVKDILIYNIQKYLADSTQAQTQKQTQIQLLNIQKKELHESKRSFIEYLTIQTNSKLKDNIDHFRKVYEQLMKDLIIKHQEETTANQNTIKSLQQQLKTTTEWSNLWLETLMEDMQQKEIELTEQQEDYYQRTNTLKNQLQQLQRELTNNRVQLYQTREEIKRSEQRIHLMEENINIFSDIFFYIQTHTKQTYHQIFDYIHNLPASQNCPELIDTIKIFYYKEHLIQQQFKSLQQQLQNAEDKIKALQKVNPQKYGKTEIIQNQRLNNQFIHSESMPSNKGSQKQILILKDLNKILNKKYNQISDSLNDMKSKNQLQMQTIIQHQTTIQLLNSQLYALQNEKRSYQNKGSESEKNIRQINESNNKMTHKKIKIQEFLQQNNTKSQNTEQSKAQNIKHFQLISYMNEKYKSILNTNVIKDNLLAPHHQLENYVVELKDKISNLERNSSINKLSQMEMENKIKCMEIKIQQSFSIQQQNQILKEQICQLQKDNTTLKQNFEYQKEQSSFLAESKKQLQNSNDHLIQQIQNLQNKIGKIQKSSIKSSSMINIGQPYSQYPKNLLKKKTSSRISITQHPSLVQFQSRKELFGWTSLLQKMPFEKENLIIKIEQYSKSRIKNTKLLFHSNETNQNISRSLDSSNIKSNSLAFVMRNAKNYFAIVSMISPFKDIPQCILICLTTGKVVYPLKQIASKGFRFQTFGLCIGEKQYIIKNQAKILVIAQSPSPYFQSFIKQEIFGEQNSQQKQIRLDETQIYRISFD